MTPEQHSGAEPLSPEQCVYLSQMQHQMKNTSVADLKAQLSAAMSPYGEINTMLGKFSDTFSHTSGVPK